MDTQHAALIKRSYDEPDERRTPPRSTVDVVHLGNVSSARLMCYKSSMRVISLIVGALRSALHSAIETVRPRYGEKRKPHGRKW